MVAVKLKSLPVALIALMAVAFPSIASAGAFSGSNGWITYSTTSGSGMSMTFQLKGIKPDGTTTTFASWTMMNPTTAVDKVPSWSADGSKVGWYGGSGQNQVLKISKMDGSNAQSLGTGAFASGIAPSISSDGTKIAVALDCDIYLVNVANSETIGSSTKVVDGGQGTTCAMAPALSSTGAIAYTRGGSNCSTYLDVWVLDNPSPGNPSFGRELLTTCNNSQNRDTLRGGPTWSPDGTKIVYATDTSNLGDSIYTVGPDDTGKTAVYTTSSSSIELGPSPTFSPDGTKIAFTEEPNSGFLYVVNYMNADGTGVTTTSATTQSTDSVSWGPAVDSGGGGSDSGASKPATPAASAPAGPTNSTVGPEVKVTTVPQEIVVEIPSTPGAAPVANVPCEAANGDALQSCTVDMKAPTAALLGQGDGVIVQQARASKTFVVGKATVTAKGGKKRIVVPVKINAKGRTALSRNIRLKVTVGITTVTLANAKSSGSTDTEMQLPRQVLSPQDGIFNTLSTTLNANGVSFVKRLAALLPDAPKAIVCTGYADNTGVPGDNRWLGDRRAKALCAALEARGIEAKTTSIVSKGATDPRADNSTAKGRELNRRATVTITY